jgi:hypothetical protein
MGPALQSLFYLDDSDIVQSSVSKVPPEGWNGSLRTCESLCPQTIVSTPSISWPGSHIDESGMNLQDKTPKKRNLDPRKPPYASRALQSVEAMEADPNSWGLQTGPVGQGSEISSDNSSYRRRIDPPDWTQGILDLEKLDEDTFNQHLNLRVHNRPESSAERMPHTSPQFSTKVSNLSSGRTTLVVVEHTNETLPEVQEFLERTNHPFKSQKGRKQSDSALRKVETTWEHTILPKTHFTEAVNERLPRDTPQKLGRRTRPLATDIRAKAKEMRKIRSCVRCKVAKTAVS